MSLETPRERLVYQGVIPVVAAILGGLAATWFQSLSFDNAQIADIIALLKDPALSAEQKIQALKMYQEITDRPWSVVRTLLTYLGITLGSVTAALVFGGYFNRRT